VLLPLPLPGSFVLARGVASIRSLLRIRSLLPILLHNARKKAPHDRQHGRGLKRPIPDERDEQIPHEARDNAQLVPNLSLDSSWQGINHQARQRDDTDNLSYRFRSNRGVSNESEPLQRVYHGQQSNDSQRNGESLPMFYTSDPELPGLEATTLFDMSTLPLDG